MITPELVKAYKNSEMAREAIKILEKRSQTVGMAMHTRCRNYLMVLSSATNATRTGGIIGMTLKQFSSAKFYPQYGNYIVEVKLVNRV